jgi:hypothetical protein
MTPGQRSDYRKRLAVARVRKVRPVGARRINENDYAAAFEAAGGTFEEWAAGLTLDDLAERSRPARNDNGVEHCAERLCDIARGHDGDHYDRTTARRWPQSPRARADLLAYVPVPWHLFDSADRYQVAA